MKYEIWNKEDLTNRRGLPKHIHFTIDVAMDVAKELSKDIQKVSVWFSNYNASEGGYKEVIIPKSFAVIERSDRQSRIRGWGIGGKWKDACQCKRCSNSGREPSSFNEPCSSCMGASFNPKI